MVGNPAYTINHLAIYLDLAEGVNCIEVSTALENGDGLPHSWLRMFEIYKTYTYNCFWTVCWLFQISCQYSWLSIEIWLIGWSVCDILLKSDVSCLIALRLLTILCNEITSPRTLVAIRGLARYNLAHASKEDCWLFEIWIGNCPRTCKQPHPWQTHAIMLATTQHIQNERVRWRRNRVHQAQGRRTGLKCIDFSYLLTYMLKLFQKI